MGPKWDRRFLDLAEHIARWSKDPSTQVGAVIVRPDRTIASHGFNGFARGLPDDPALYADREFKIATVVHAEENALLNTTGSLEGCTLYVSGLPPCASCASKIIQKRIARVVAYDAEVPERWRRNMAWAADNLRIAGVVLDRLPVCEDISG